MKTLILALALLATPVAADISVTFIEGAPKDRFRIVNTGSCAVEGETVQIDVSDAAGGLIFDVTGTGAGVEVFQPFEVSDGATALSALPRVTDGDQRIDLALAVLPPGAEFSFTIDMDDTADARGTIVSAAELAGAVVRMGERSAAFGPDARAVLQTDACIS